MRSETPTVLKRICDRKLEEIAERKALTDIAALKEKRISSRGATRLYSST